MEVGRSLYTRQQQGYVQEIHAILAVPVALPDVVAVIFPPADRPGFDVAYAGFGKPWVREHLIDTPPDQVGALDAVATGDGGLVAVMRPRNETVPVTIIQWRPGAAPMVETVTTDESGQAVGWSADRCPDISVAVDPSGGLAVLYRDFKPSDGTGRVMLAQRTKGASNWTRTVADQDNRPWYTNPGTGIIGELGCKNRVAFDETGRPRVLTLHRGIPYSATDSLNPTMGAHAPGAWVTPLFLGADGRFHNESRSFGSTCECYGGEFDVDVNPDGEILAGLAEQSAKPNLYLTVLSFIGVGFKGNNSPIFQWASGDPNTRYGGSPQVDECGRAPVLMSARLGYWSMGGQPGGCWMQR